MIHITVIYLTIVTGHKQVMKRKNDVCLAEVSKGFCDRAGLVGFTQISESLGMFVEKSQFLLL